MLGLDEVTRFQLVLNGYLIKTFNLIGIGHISMYFSWKSINKVTLLGVLLHFAPLKNDKSVFVS